MSTRLEIFSGIRQSHQRRDSSVRAVEEPLQKTLSTRIDIESPSLMKPSPQSKPPDLSSLGYAAIFGVAFLWGANVPALRYMFLLDHPPSSALLNCLQASISAVVLAGSVALLGNKKSKPNIPADGDLSCVVAGGEHICVVNDEDKVGGRRAPKNAFERVISDALNWTSGDIKLAGGELGLWMCLAFGLEIAGCEFISATKTAFLMQATVLITPILVFLSGARVNKNEWAACGLGLAGSILVALDGLSQSSADVSVQVQQENEILGYILVLLSTLFFSMGTVRLGQYSSRFDSLSLSNASTISLAICSFVWLIFSSQGEGDSLAETANIVVGILTNPTSLAVMLWLGVASGAFASFLLTTGQKTVPPAQAQVILSTTPLFSTGIAMIVLDASDEAMGGIAWVGAGLMILASVVASTGSPEEEKKGAV